MWIDIHAFPHIVSSIVAYTDTDWTTYLSLRTLSRDIRDEIDKRLFHHIVVTPPFGDDESHGLELREPHPPFRHLPSFPPIPETPAPAQLAYTRVVDYYGTRMSLRPLALALKNAVYLRRRRCLTSPLRLPCSTVVDVGNLTYLEPESGEYLVRLLPLPTVPPGVTRHVYHLVFEAGANGLDEAATIPDYPRSLVEAVIVLQPYTGANHVDNESDDVPLGFLSELSVYLYALLVGNAAATVTIVGIERCPPGLFGILRSDDLTRSVKDMMKRKLAKWADEDPEYTVAPSISGYSPQQQAEILQRVAMDTMDDWLESLPPEARGVEDTWPAYTYARIPHADYPRVGLPVRAEHVYDIPPNEPLLPDFDPDWHEYWYRIGEPDERVDGIADEEGYFGGEEYIIW